MWFKYQYLVSNLGVVDYFSFDKVDLERLD